MRISPHAATLTALTTLTVVSLAYAYYAYTVITRPAPEPDAVYYSGHKVCYSIDSHTRMEKIPHLHNTWQLTTECRIDPEEVFTAISMFYEGWTDEFGIDENLNILRAFSNLTIEWAEEPYEISDDVWYQHFGGLPQSKGFIYGEAKEGRIVWIVRSMTGNLYDEPKRFLHELVHIALRASDPASKGDWDHEGPIIKAWTKRHTKLIQTVGNYIIALNQESDI